MTPWRFIISELINCGAGIIPNFKIQSIAYQSKQISHFALFFGNITKYRYIFIYLLYNIIYSVLLFD